MNVDAPRGLLRYFDELPDPRMDRTKRHLLGDIITIAICAVIRGADGWVQVATFGRSKRKRIEQRRIWATSEIGWFAERKKWKGLRSLIRVEARRTVNGETSVEYHYYISSLGSENPDRLLELIRGHWGIENSVHWSLDISFREDECRIRKGNGAENFSRLNRIALNLLKVQTKQKVGIKTKRLRAGWDHDFLLSVLNKQQHED